MVDWHGWLLTYASHKCLPTSVLPGSQNNPFWKVHTEQWLLKERLHLNDEGTYDPRSVASMFNDLNNTVVLSSTVAGNFSA